MLTNHKPILHPAKSQRDIVTKKRYLSREIAPRVDTDALTATPCINGVTLHITAPNTQPESRNKYIRIVIHLYLSCTGLLIICEHTFYKIWLQMCVHTGAENDTN